MKRLATTLLLAPALAVTATAQTLIVPASAAGGGDSTGAVPFGYTNYVRYQQAIGTSHFPGATVLFGMSLRVRTTWPNTPDNQVQGLRVRLSDCVKPATQLDATFANNVGSNVVTVFDSTVVVQLQNSAAPGEFSVLIPFDQPYLHVNTAPLLIDMVPTSLGTLPCGKGGNGTECDAVRSDPDMSSQNGKGTCAAPPTTASGTAPGGFVIEFWTANVLMPFGRGCAGSSLPQISSTGVATPGNAAFAVQLTQAPSGTPSLAALLLGASAAKWGATTLPWELTTLGMPGCYLLAAPDVSFGATVAAGAASAPLPIPNAAALVGQHVFAQWFTVADGANAFGGLLTQAGRITIR